MAFANDKIFSRCLLAVLLMNVFNPPASAQAIENDSYKTNSSIESLGLTEAQVSRLKQAIDAHDYITAENLLLQEISRDPNSLGAARLLAYAGSIYFLNSDYLNAAIAWKKSDAISPLPPSLNFSLSMAYIHLKHPDWARKVLESLAERNKTEALYPYWLGRLDYDAQQYTDAISHFKQAIILNPSMARAYDNLGLCYFYRNDNALAIENYKKSIELDRNASHPSAWPHINLAITLEFLNQLDEAEANLREAIRLDPALAQAHYQLGIVLETRGQSNTAVDALREAARLDAAYAEPHYALARIYHKLGQATLAQQEVHIYTRLHAHSQPNATRINP